MKYGLLLCLLLTAGCVKGEIKPEPPTKPIAAVPEVKIYYATRKIELDSVWFKPCLVRQIQTYTIDELNRVIRSLQACVDKNNEDKRKIKQKLDESH